MVFERTPINIDPAPIIMADSGRIVTRFFCGDKSLGSVVVVPMSKRLPFKPGEEFRVSSFSPASDRCFPLVVLHTLANDGVLIKLEPPEFSNLSAESRELEMVYSSCIKEAKTAIVSLPGGLELHLVAMNGGRKQWPCFWGFLIASGLYSSCLNMLNLRCLALVFDLDETLIVANTMRSFEDRIEALGSKIKGETDAQKLSGMSGELKRYIQDRALLKQYVDDNHVWDSTAERFVNAQVEVVPPMVEGGLPIMRPVVRMHERNMIFTRINPANPDTSVLVRLRPAWEDLRSYLTAKGRKRFEVFICTMSEKEYALEMWRLLDPDGQLISTREMMERVVCVKSGSKKSLTNVFANGNCHPKMAMVIDDRLKVWEDRDQLHVHVVPAFAPYYAPQAETNIPVPILCVARNVACNVRGGFFRDFDEGLSKRMAEVDYDADVSSLPQPPVLSNYLVAEEDTGPVDELANGIKMFPDGMTDTETSSSLTEVAGTFAQFQNNNRETEGQKTVSMQQPSPIVLPSSLQKIQPPFGEAQVEEKLKYSCLQADMPTLRPVIGPVESFEASRQSSPVREEGEVPESELDPDTRRRLLILRHGQDTEHHENAQESPIDPPFSTTATLHLANPSPAPAGGWLGAEEELSPRQLSRSSSTLVLEPESPSFRKQHSHLQSFFGSEVSSGDVSSMDRRNAVEEVFLGDERQRSEAILRGHVLPEKDGSSFSNISNPRELQMRTAPGTGTPNSVNVLQEIAQKCNTRLEFKSLLNTTKELQFSVEVLFGGEKVGEGIGRTKKEAQHKAAENSLRFMASQFISHPTQAITILGHASITNPHPSDEPALQWNSRDPRYLARLGPLRVDDDMPIASTSGQSKLSEVQSVREPSRAYNPVAALKDHCTIEGINVVFKNPSPSELQPQGFLCQVEVAGSFMGRGSGRSWEEAKQQAAEEALRRLKTPQLRGPLKRTNAPGSPPLQSNKRVRSGELPRGLQRLPSSPHKLSPGRYTNNGPSVS